LQGSIAMPRLV
jgi:hypothetical protein